MAQLISPPSAPAVSTNPAIGTSPTSLSFTAQQGSSNPSTQTLNISNTGGGTLSWSASDSMAWLSLSPASGTGAGAVTLSVTTGALTAGSYTGTVILSATGASSVTVPVTFTVTAAPLAPAIGASPASFSFTAQVGSNPATQTLTISNTGGGTLNWTASDNAPWLTLSTASGTGNSPTTLTVNTAALTAGSHNALITLSAPGATSVTLPVALTVTAAPVPPAIGVSPISLSFTAQQGGANPATQALAISNTGGGTLTWTASDDAAWLSVSPASGTGNGPATVTAILGTLATGTHTGTITLSATGASSVSIPVSLTVTAAPVPPAIGASPTSLTFAATQGGANPANQTLTISNTGGGTLNWSVSDSAAWLTASPTSGAGNGSVTLTVATGTLTAGSHTGTVTIAATGATSVTIPVTFAVTAPPAIGMSPSSLSFTAQQGGGNPAAQTLNISNTGGGTLSWSASLDTTWLAATPSSATGNGTVSIRVTTGTLTAGSYTGTITLSATGASNRTVPVTFTVTAAPIINLNPTSLSYAATQGASNPANQTVTLTMTGGATNWTVSDSVSWLSVTPTSGSGSSTVTSNANTAGLAAGTYTGTITVSATGALSKTVTVTLTINAPTTSSVTLTWAANTESDLAGYKVYRATSSGAYGAPLVTLTGNITSYVATGLQSGTTYFFVVTSYDSAGNESARSTEVSKSIF
ncbi:MAG: choice-of-anchor D domain-containing protein [Nitrospira sp.]|nr:choice-of-anchor D domain-containing protein [Nitrospira sp.]